MENENTSCILASIASIVPPTAGTVGMKKLVSNIIVFIKALAGLVALVGAPHLAAVLTVVSAALGVVEPHVPAIIAAARRWWRAARRWWRRRRPSGGGQAARRRGL